MTQTDSHAPRVDQRAADLSLYLHELFDDTEGYVHAASLDRRADGGWHALTGIREGQRGVPAQRRAMLDGLAEALVLEADTGVDVFTCPYPLIGSQVRENGRATTRRYAHADVDGPVQMDRVRALGAWAVASGTTAKDGTPHAHVYVRLTESVPAYVHTVLCRALGQAVGGEHHDVGKVNDSDVLRPPGTLNYKHEPSPVAWLVRPDDLDVRAWAPGELARELGAPWPVPLDDEDVAKPVAVQPPTAQGGRAERRVGGLVVLVRDAAPATGNSTLNYAAGVCAALIASTGDQLDAGEVREQLVQAYLARPLRGRDTPRRREREARRTLDSAWRWGTAHPAKALTDRRPPSTDDDDEDHDVTARTTNDAPEPEAAAEGPLPAEESAAFWSSRELLGAVRDYARARRIGRWALLGAVLARAAAEVPPSVVLPPTRGTVASLNLYVGLCSEFGGGKSAAMGAAAEVLEVRGGAGPLETSLGSGEGLLAAYVHVQKEKGQAPRVVQHRTSVLFDVDEVGSLGALAARTNSTLLPFLKSAWSGRLLATQNADADRLRRVEAHAYRLAVVAGVQPKHAGTILDDDGGGFPQRWLWMPTYDPAMPSRDEEVPEPLPYCWHVPGMPVEMAQDGTVTVQRARPMVLPAEAAAAILEAAEASNRPIGAGGATPGASAMDGHALLSRAKVAALLALLEGRGQEVTAADWSLAGVVMRVSDHTRAAIVHARSAEASREADRRAIRQGRSAAIAATSEENVRMQQVCSRVRELLAGAEGGELTESRIGEGVTRSRRDLVGDALELMTSNGEVVSEERVPPRRRQPSTFYRLVAR